MGCRCAPALAQLRKQLNALYPDRDTESDGCCGDAKHAARKSDHNPNAAGYATAEDIDEDLVAGMGDRQLTDWGLRLLADDRTKYEIYEAELLYPDGTRKPYKGINDHRHHLHLSIKPSAVHDTRPWPMPRQEHEMPSPKEIAMNRMVLDKPGDKTLWFVFVDIVTGLGICKYRIPTEAAAENQVQLEMKRRKVPRDQVRQTWAGSRLDPIAESGELAA